MNKKLDLLQKKKTQKVQSVLWEQKAELNSFTLQCFLRTGNNKECSQQSVSTSMNPVGRGSPSYNQSNLPCNL